MRYYEFIKENKTTLNKLYNGNFPDRDESFWDEVRPHEFDNELEVKTIPKHKLAIMLQGQYRVEHLDELLDMMDEDQQEILQRYMNDPSLSNKIILLSGDRIIDGNHRALAAAMKGVPINYVDLADLDEQDVAEGFDKEAGAWRDWQLKMLPRKMDMLSKLVKGWVPSEEDHIAAIEAGYDAMKETGDVKDAAKAIADTLKEIQRRQGVAEGLNEAVDSNYLYHSTETADTAKKILSSGVFKAGNSNQDVTNAQVGNLPTVSFGRNIAYQISGENVNRDYEVVFVVDRSKLEQRYKTFGTSQSRENRGLAFPKPGNLKAGEIARSYDVDKSGNLDKRDADEIHARGTIQSFGKPAPRDMVGQFVGRAKQQFYAPKSGGEFEEVVPTKTGMIPWHGMLVGFYLVPGKAASRDSELLNHPLRLDMPRPNQFVKAKQQQGVEEDTANLPSVLYHATYKPRLKSIKLKGLGAGGKRNWEDSKRGIVYLSLDPNVAESYAETSDMVPEEWLDEIVILKISTAGLDPNKFHIDSNVQDNAGDTIEYHGVIPVSNISMYKQGVAEDTVDEMALSTYKTMGDFTKQGPFTGADKKLVPHSKNIEKATRFFEQTPFDFRLFFSNIPGTGKYSEHGPMTPDELKKVFGKDAEEIIDGSQDAITVVYVGNKGDRKVMLTPWMMAHRFGHAVNRGAYKAGYAGAWKEAEKHFFNTVNSLLNDYYGKIGRTGSDIKYELTPEYNALFNAIGTQRSSRSGEIRRPYEFFYELFAQYLGTGQITLNPFPTNLTYGRKAWGNPTRFMNIKPEYRDETERKYAAEVLARDMEILFNDVLSDSVGKIFVM